MYQKISVRGWILLVVSHRVQEGELLLSPRCANHLIHSGSNLLHVHLKCVSRVLYAQSRPLLAKLPPHPKPIGADRSSTNSNGSTHQSPPVATFVSPVSTTPSHQIFWHRTTLLHRFREIHFFICSVFTRREGQNTIATLRGKL